MELKLSEFGEKEMRNEGFGNKGPRRSAGGFRGGFQQRSPPVKEGEEIDVKIEAIAEKGDGVAKRNGFVIFVPGTKVGDNVKVRIKKVLRNMSFAEVISQGSESPSSEEFEDKTPDTHDEEGDYSSEEPSDDYGEGEDSEDF